LPASSSDPDAAGAEKRNPYPMKEGERPRIAESDQILDTGS